MSYWTTWQLGQLAGKQLDSHLRRDLSVGKQLVGEVVRAALSELLSENEVDGTRADGRTNAALVEDGVEEEAVPSEVVAVFWSETSGDLEPAAREELEHGVPISRPYAATNSSSVWWHSVSVGAFSPTTLALRVLAASNAACTSVLT